MYGGDALGRSEDGRIIMMPLALPGELVRFEPLAEKPHLVRARLLEVLEPSPERASGAAGPRCPHFGVCGGCQYQHIASAAYQLEQKRLILGEVLARMGKIALPEGVEIAAVGGEPWGYRNRIQLHISERRIGYHAAGSHDIEPIQSCAIASPRLAEALQSLRNMKRSPRWPRFIRSLELFTNESDVQVNVLDSGPQRVNRGFFEWCASSEGNMAGALAPALDYPVGSDLTFRVSHKSFFQVNRFLLDRLVNLALENAEGETALDLYAGVGLFSLPLSRRFRNVTAVEAVNSATADLTFNAERHGRSANLRIVKSRTEDYLAGIDATAPGFDFVLADPPRAGLGKLAVDALIRLAPRRLHIVSCDPPTLARDLQALLAAGYQIEGITMVDLFPQTAHIESVTRLKWGKL